MENIYRVAHCIPTCCEYSELNPETIGEVLLNENVDLDRNNSCVDEAMKDWSVENIFNALYNRLPMLSFCDSLEELHDMVSRFLLVVKQKHTDKIYKVVPVSYMVRTAGDKYVADIIKYQYQCDSTFIQQV